jgi:hypothetical protein
VIMVMAIQLVKATGFCTSSVLILWYVNSVSKIKIIKWTTKSTLIGTSQQKM